MATINIKYFGEIAEKTGKSSEAIAIEKLNTTSILKFLKQQYAIADKGIQIAINQELVTEEIAVLESDEIAILSPFAGG